MFDRIGQFPMMDLVGQGYPQLGVGPTLFPMGDYYGCGPGGAPAFPIQQYPLAQSPMAPPPPQAYMAPQPPPPPVVDAAGQYPGGYGGFPGGYGGYAYGLAAPVNPLLVQQIEQTAAFFKPRYPTRLQKQWLGFPRVCIKKCETVRICVTAQVFMKVIRIIIPSNVAWGLLVDDIIVAKEHLVNGDGVTGEAFVPDATNVQTSETETLSPGTDICIILTNISDDDLRVSVGALAWVGY